MYKKQRTRKQKPIIMIGCSKKNKKSCKNTFFSSLGNKDCPKCGSNCRCGPNCKCQHPCPGNCYLNRHYKKQKGGFGCGSCGCPISPLSWNGMNKFVGGNSLYPNVLEQPVLIDSHLNKGQFIPTPGATQNGGSCSACVQTQVVPQSGGNFFKQAAPIPGPRIGLPWEPNNLPGENGVGGDRNYFNPYNTNNNPQLRMSIDDAGYKTFNSMIGGKRTASKLRSKYRSSKRMSAKRGGGLIPQDLIDLGRLFNHNSTTAYNALNGYKAPVSHLPYKDQLPYRV
jgi:hypothetical protein